MLWIVGIILIIGGYYFIKAEDLKRENKELLVQLDNIKNQVKELDETEKELDEFVRANKKLNSENKSLKSQVYLLNEQLQSYQNYKQRETELEQVLQDTYLKLLQAEQDNISLTRMLDKAKESKENEAKEQNDSIAL